ncbi:MAG: hypothetical protein AXW12_08650 [Thalassospira sp. Nap_22]|nr:MAG: hypothetical protein AXW12_08650 [Thalassospira sp. Nap_22]
MPPITRTFFARQKHDLIGRTSCPPVFWTNPLISKFIFSAEQQFAEKYVISTVNILDRPLSGTL